MKFLGWKVGPQGLSVPEENVEALLARDRPSNVREVESFLGYINYHRSHLINIAEKAAPLYELTGGKARKAKFVWGDQHQKAFH